MKIVVVGTQVKAIEQTPAGVRYEQWMGTMEGNLAVLSCLVAPSDTLYPIARIGADDVAEYATYLTGRYGACVDTSTLLPDPLGTNRVEDIQLDEERKVWTQRPFTPIRFEDIPGDVLHDADAIIFNDGGPETYDSHLIAQVKAQLPSLFVYVDVHCKVCTLDPDGWMQYGDWPGWVGFLAPADAVQLTTQEADALLDRAPLFDKCVPYPDRLVVRTLVDAGLQAANLTMGALGVTLCAYRGVPEHIQAMQLGQPVDPCGAGDAFGGAYVASVLQGYEPTEAAQIGNALAALTCMKLGYLTPADTPLDQIDALVRDTYGDPV